jgi:hypothetical protein
MPVTAVCVCATTQVAAEVTHSCPHATFSIAGITENQEFPANTAQSQDVLASQERYRTDKAELDAALEQWSTRRRHYVKQPDDAQAHQGEERTPLRRRRSPDLASERRRRLRGDAQPEPMIKFAEHITRCDAVVSTASDPDFAGFAPNRGAGASSVVSGMVD